MGLFFKGMSLSFKGKKIGEGWIGTITYYGLSSLFILFRDFFFYGNVDSLIFYVRGQERSQAGQQKSLGIKYDSRSGDYRLDVSLWLLRKLFLKVFQKNQPAKSSTKR